MAETNQLNCLCYCQSVLERYHEIQNQLQCTNCCKPMLQKDEGYYCKNQQCYYKSVSGQQYHICLECYNESNATSPDYAPDASKKIQFITLKFNGSLSRIS